MEFATSILLLGAMACAGYLLLTADDPRDSMSQDERDDWDDWMQW